jgi:hypothetical protein
MQMSIRFQYTETYPSTPPRISLENCRFLDDHDQTELLRVINEAAKQNLNMPMVYILIHRTLEWLEEYQLLIKKRSEEKRISEEERAENARSQGTPVTSETFLNWKKAFNEERLEKLLGCKMEEIKEVRLSGKQLFERDATLVTSDVAYGDDLEEEEEEDYTYDRTRFESDP